MGPKCTIAKRARGLREREVRLKWERVNYGAKGEIALFSQVMCFACQANTRCFRKSQLMCDCSNWQFWAFFASQLELLNLSSLSDLGESTFHSKILIYN